MRNTPAARQDVLMVATIEAYYDFGSPYTYFANHRTRTGSFVLPVAAKWLWRPFSIDVLLNLPAGRDAWAAYGDPLSAPSALWRSFVHASPLHYLALLYPFPHTPGAATAPAWVD
jgi:hypothetical protein